MENQNGNPSTSTPNSLENLKKMFSEYQKSQTPKSQQSGSRKREDILAKYFVPRKTKEFFRVLPPKNGRKHIEEAFFHVVPTNSAGGKKKYNTVIYCPAHNDPKVQKMENGKPVFDMNGKPVMVHKPCPLCQKYKEMIMKQDQSLKNVKKEEMTSAQLAIKEKNDKIYKDAVVWEAKKFYIIRGIDKGAEKDGVKFWRFKHNYKNQGTLNKLLPIIEDYVSENNVDFTDPEFGTDLTITMADSEFAGHVYKAISAISARGKSKLSSDPILARQWLEDNVTWRDVFLPKKAPNITPEEYLEMVANGVSPYWDDTDPNNKKWVFPGRPDLEEKANTRTLNLDSDNDDYFEHASDLEDDEYPRVTINNITSNNVGSYNDNAVEIGDDFKNETEQNRPEQNEENPSMNMYPSNETNVDESVENSDDSSDDYNDLPF